MLRLRCARLLRATRRYLPIVFHLAHSNIKKEAAETFGGFLWWIGEPLLYAIIYYFVFAIIFEAKTENFIAFLLIGLTVWRWVSRTVTSTATSVSGSAALMRQVHVPKLVFPLRTILVNTQRFILSLAVIVLVLAIMGQISISNLFHVLFVFLVAGVFVSGVGIVLSVITPFFPDMQKFNTLAFRALLFLSGVFFESSRVPEDVRFYYYLNPFVTIVESARDVFLYDTPPDFGRNLAILAGGTVILLVGIALHLRLNRVFPRYLI